MNKILQVLGPDGLSWQL